MRIISGIYKSRLIRMPKGIRPTQDKIRKALFDILPDMTGLSFLELFAGSGAVGLEAVSRGVRELTLVEYNRDCLVAIRKNIASLKMKACVLYPKEVLRAIRNLCGDERKFDIIFLDPPYYKGAVPRIRPQPSPRKMAGSLTKKTLQILGAYDILAPNGLVVIQHFKKDSLPETEGDLILFRQSRYADTLLSFYRKR